MDIAGEHNHDAVTEEDVATDDVVDFLEPEAPLLLPHRMLTVSPSISRPLAHACAASSAVALSFQLTKAHLNGIVSLFRSTYDQDHLPRLCDIHHGLQLRRLYGRKGLEYARADALFRG